MTLQPIFSEMTLINGSTGDPVLYVDYPDRDNALLFDAGDNSALEIEKLADLEAVFISHHHVDHFIGLDRIVRANIDSDKTLSIFGPEGTIRKAYERIRSYEYQYFPFQKIVIRVHELLENGRGRQAVLECRRRFPEPKIEEFDWSDGRIFENDEVKVEAVAVEHVVPCLAYALVEKPGYRLNEKKMARGVLRPGAWVTEMLAQLEGRSEKLETLEIEGGTFRVRDLAQRYFSKSRGVRIAFVTDTAWNDDVRMRLIKLARGAHRLYCDSFYGIAQAKQAAKYRHMTTHDCARFATEAKIDQLIQIHFSQRYHGRYEKLVEEARSVFPNASAVL